MQVSEVTGGAPHRWLGAVAPVLASTHARERVRSAPPQLTGHALQLPMAHRLPIVSCPPQSVYPHLPGLVV